MIPTDPPGTSGFVSDTVLGQTRQVYAFNGMSSPPSQQSGLTVNTTSLIPSHSYSVDMVLELTQRDGAWRRLIDVENRQSDDGFYVNPNNNLEVFPVAGTTNAWTNNVYHHVVLTTDGTNVNGYIDGQAQFTIPTPLMNLDNANNPNLLMNFFLDNTAGGGQGEYSPGRVSLIRLWDGVLTGPEAQALANNPFLPEPSALAFIGVASIAFMRRTKSRR